MPTSRRQLMILERRKNRRHSTSRERERGREDTRKGVGQAGSPRLQPASTWALLSHQIPRQPGSQAP